LLSQKRSIVLGEMVAVEGGVGGLVFLLIVVGVFTVQPIGIVVVVVGTLVAPRKKGNRKSLRRHRGKGRIQCTSVRGRAGRRVGQCFRLRGQALEQGLSAGPRAVPFPADRR
jgi:hypothetical protein